MILTPEEISDIELLCKKNATVQKLYDFYMHAVTNQAEMLRSEIKEMSAIFANDLKKIRTDGPEAQLKILGSNKDDKLFERVMSVIEKAPKIYAAISTSDAEQQDDSKKSYIDRQADKNRNKIK